MSISPAHSREPSVMEPTTTNHVLPTIDTTNGAFKRKRSPSAEPHSTPAPPAKSSKTHSSHLQINYLARQYSDILSLVSIEDSLPTILQLLSDYTGVLERHESLAGNLGARPLGPILIKRFERLFDGPPRVLKSHGKEGTFVTWLDVVEFARHKPEQFNLEKMRDGVRVCQFYTKQSRVEISEEDYYLISSGMPQRLIPPQPIPDDEEKELGTLEIMEKSITQIVQVADQVSARARQFKHRLLGRKNAIINRRESEAASAEVSAGTPIVDVDQRSLGSPGSASGFAPVNKPSSKEVAPTNASQALYNGKTAAAATSASAAIRTELLSQFSMIRERQGDGSLGDGTPSSISRSHGSKSKPKPSGSSDMDYASILLNSASPVPIPNTPSNLVHYPRPSQAERLDDSGPYKAEMLSRMEGLQRGDRVLPPCDRCRRLQMDCLKNLTACQGCTRKHAKCSWKDVTEQELLDNPRAPPKEDDGVPNGDENAAVSASAQPVGPPQPVRDEELLGEDDSDDDMHPATIGIHRSVEPEQSKIISLKISPKMSPGLSKPAETTKTTTTLDQTTRDTVDREKMDYKRADIAVQEPKAAQEDIQAAARDILQKRLGEPTPVATTISNGFSPVNRLPSEPTPEVRIHEPSKDVHQSPKVEERLQTPETVTTIECKPDVSYQPPTVNGFTATNEASYTKTSPPTIYRPYE